MFVPLCGLLIGIMAARLGATLWVGCGCILLGCVLYLLILRLGRAPVRSFTLNKFHFIWLLVVFVGVGITSFEFQRPTELDNDGKDVKIVEGRISKKISSTAGDRLIVEGFNVYDNDGNATNVDNLSILVKCNPTEWNIDDCILVSCNLNRIKDSENYFATGYARSMQNRGILYESQCESDKIVFLQHRSTFTGSAENIRGYMEAAIENTHLNKATQNFLITILLGDRAYLLTETRELFADAGISHVLALSGMHVGILATIIMSLLFPINFFGLYRYRYLLSTVILLFYAYITGWSPSTVRSTLMALTFVVCLFLERKNSGWNSLLLATFIILLISPCTLFDFGLQLSFLCVASLIFFVRPLNPVNQHDHHRLYSICAALLATLVATAATWVSCAYNFGLIPIMFIPANIIVLPLLPFYLIISIVYFLLSAVDCDLSFMAWIIDGAYDELMKYLAWLSGDAKSAYNFTPSEPSVWLWLGFIAACGVWIHGKRTKLKIFICAAFLTTFVISLSTSTKAGLHDAFIIQKQNNRVTLLTRTGDIENEIEMARHGISSCDIAGKKIISADMSLANLPEDFKEHCDILILSGGIREDLPLILGKIEASEIVIHPSVRRKRETGLMQSADSLGVPYHSIRLHGPFRYDVCYQNTSN